MALTKRKKSRQPTQRKGDTSPMSFKGEPTLALETRPVDLYGQLKSRHLNSSIFGSLTETINKVSRDKNSVMLHVELYINQRHKTKELERLRDLLQYFSKDLNKNERTYISYEELCSMFQVDHPFFLAAVMGGYYQASLSIAQIKIVNGMPQIADRLIERATSNKGGTKDTELALKVTGMLSEASQVSIVNNAIGHQENSQVNIAANISVPDFKSEILSLDEMIRDSYESARNGNKVVPDNIIEAEVVDV